MIKKVLIFIAVIFIAMKVTGAIGYGLITLVGLIALIETVPLLKWIVKKFTSFIDVMIFVLTIFATAKLGYNITASLVIAGVGYTLVYAPYVRREAKIKSMPKKNSNNPASGYDWS